jgi:hypothetical protein
LLDVTDMQGGAMISKKWCLKLAAGWGAVLGGPMLLARSYMEQQTLPTDPAHLISYVLGGVAGGAFVFVVIAALRNSVTK